MNKKLFYLAILVLALPLLPSCQEETGDQSQKKTDDSQSDEKKTDDSQSDDNRLPQLDCSTDGYFCGTYKNVEYAYKCENKTLNKYLACGEDEFCGLSQISGAYCDYKLPDAARTYCAANADSSSCQVFDGDTWSIVCNADGSAYVGDLGSTNCTGYEVYCVEVTDAVGTYSKCSREKE